MQEILLKGLLDWPILLFVFLTLFVIIFRKQLLGMLSRGDITISWGDGRSIRLRELSDGLDEELDPIRSDIDDIKEAIKKLQPTAKVHQTEQLEQTTENVPDHREKDARDRMNNALLDGRYRWRSIERLAVIGGVSTNEVEDILRSDPEVVFSVGKSRRKIAKLKSR